ncbi:hypothetical protein PSTEL_04125 [Paenibacillus stellifer]|uniref:Uncharacterized protein n=1 Tax=Paenibacillus stellifer TaxID=169760 RepID=A0A089LTA1_9BACL|nr:hypothetical protein [Paenibacillus stellifer]AIQ62413.1 hypothetical protein PSTEL_04125 [Paenibacillus stellifer]
MADGTSKSHADDVIRLDTPNAELACSTHPETGVPYETKILEMPNGHAYEGIFTDFKRDSGPSFMRACTRNSTTCT